MSKSKILNLNNLIQNETMYNKLMTKLEKQFLTSYTDKNKKIKVELNDKVYTTTLSNIYTQLLFLFPFVNTKHYDFGNEFILFDKLTNFTADIVEDFMNDLSIELDYIDNDILNESIKYIIEKMSDLSGYFNIMNGTTMNIYDLCKLADVNKDFESCINFKIGDNLQFKEIDDDIEATFEKVQHILETENTCYRPYLNARTGMNVKQLREVVVSVGNKPNLDGNIIARPINSNFLLGLEKVLDYVILAIGGRKALYNNFSKVTESGYLTRKLSILNMDTLLDVDVEDCGTTEYLPLHVDSKKTLDRYNLRYYLNEDNELELIRTKTHQHLIGKDIMVRTPIACKGDKICKTCYGKLSKINNDIHIGLIAVLYLTNQLTQRLLSTKHLLQSNTKLIKWGDTFEKYFLVDRNEIFLKEGFDRLKLGIDFDELEYTMDNEPFLKTFYLIGKKKELKITSPVDLYITYEMTPRLLKSQTDENGRVVLRLNNVSTEDIPVFNFITENNELTTSLNNITDLIETNDRLGLDDIRDIAVKFIHLLNETGITLNAVHSELILRNLVRDPEDNTKLAKTLEPGKYELYKVSNAIINSSSPCVGLIFERQRMQLESPHIYYKEGKSIIDTMFL